MKQQVRSIFLLSVWAITSLAPSLFFLKERGRVRSSFEQNRGGLARSGEKVSFRLSVAEFEMARTGKHDIYIAGEVYDVLNSQQEGDHLFITCVKDRDESHLVRVWQHLKNNENSGDKRKPLGDDKVKFQVALVVLPDAPPMTLESYRIYPELDACSGHVSPWVQPPEA